MAKQKTPGEILREARLKQGLTQLEVAQKAAIHPNTYAKIERGENQPSSESIKKLMAVLDIDVKSLLNFLR